MRAAVQSRRLGERGLHTLAMLPHHCGRGDELVRMGRHQGMSGRASGAGLVDLNPSPPGEGRNHHTDQQTNGSGGQLNRE